MILPSFPRPLFFLVVLLLVGHVAVVAGCGSGAEPSATEGRPGSGSRVEPFPTREADAIDEQAQVRYTWRTPFEPIVRDADTLANELLVEAAQVISSITFNGEEVARPNSETARVPINLVPRRSNEESWHHTVHVFGAAESATPISRFNVVFVLDELAPRIQLMSPEIRDDEIVAVPASEVELQWRATDDVGLSEIWVRGDDLDWFRRLETPREAQGLQDITTTSTILLPRDGTFSVTLGARDVVGRDYEKHVRVLRDTTPPSVWLNSAQVMDGEHPNPIVTRDASVMLHIRAYDASGLASITLDGARLDIEAVADDMWESHVELADLSEGETRHHIVATDSLGNRASIRLSIFVDPRGDFLGAVELPVELPPIPTGAYGVESIGVRQFVPLDASIEEFVRATQAAALAEVLAASFRLSDESSHDELVHTLTIAPTFRHFAAECVYLRVTTWDEREDGIWVELTAMISHLDVVRVASRAAQWVPTTSTVDALVGTALGRVYLDTSRTLDAVAAIDDSLQEVLVALRSTDDHSVQLARTRLDDPERVVRVSSQQTWRRVERVRVVANGHAVVMVGRSREGRVQTEWIPLSDDGGEARPVSVELGQSIAWEPGAIDAVVAYDSERRAFRRFVLPNGEASEFFPAPEGILAAQPIGFLHEGRTLAVLGTARDQFGIVTPGTLFLLDMDTGERIAVHEHQDALLMHSKQWNLAANLEHVAERVSELERSLHARLSEHRPLVLLTVPNSALLFDGNSGSQVLEPLPTSWMKRALGPPLSFALDAYGRTLSVRGARGTLLIDVDTGLELARFDNDVRFAEQHPLALEVESLPGELILKAWRLPQTERAWPRTPQGVPHVARGATLGHAVVTEHDPLAEPLARAVGDWLATALHEEGYSYSASVDAADFVICFEAFYDERELRVLATLTNADSRKPFGRYVLGRWSVEHAGDLEDAVQAFVRDSLPRIEPLPELLYPLGLARFDLPQRIPARLSQWPRDRAVAADDDNTTERSEAQGENEDVDTPE